MGYSGVREAERRKIIAVFFRVFSLELEQCWLCYLYFRPKRLAGILHKKGRYCPGCKSQLEYVLTPEDMDYDARQPPHQEQDHAEPFNSRRAPGLQKLRDTDRKPLTLLDGGPPTSDRVRSCEGPGRSGFIPTLTGVCEPRRHDRAPGSPEGPGQFTDTQ